MQSSLLLISYCLCTVHVLTHNPDGISFYKKRYTTQQSDKMNVSLIHIPKTAGTSFYEQYKHRITFKRPSPGNDERSYNYLNNNDSKNYALMTFFRNPRNHVYSQYLECKWDSWGKKVTAGTNFPRDIKEDENRGYTPAFEQWLLHFNVTPFTTNMYNCYQPYNMQTRYFETSQKDAHNFKPDGTVFTDKAAQRIKDLWFFGITEHYTTSTCLFEYKVTGELPDYCDCTHEKKVAPQHEKRVTHFVPTHSIDVLSKRTVKLIDLLILQDNLLYTFALSLFKRRVRELSTQTKKIICKQYH